MLRCNKKGAQVALSTHTHTHCGAGIIVSVHRRFIEMGVVSNADSQLPFPQVPTEGGGAVPVLSREAINLKRAAAGARR